MGEGGKVFATTDGGENWKDQITPLRGTYNGIEFLDGQNGWIVGDRGAIVHSSNGGGITDISPNVGKQPEQMILRQNVPNPFNGGTLISLDLLRSGETTLTIFNLLGQRIVDLVQHEFLNAGDYHFRWKADGFNSGTYFYQLEQDGRILLKKMILLK